MGGESSRPWMACAKALGQEGVDCVGGTERRAERQGLESKGGLRGPAGSPRAPWARPSSFHVQDAHAPGPLCVCGGVVAIASSALSAPVSPAGVALPTE